MTIVFCDKNKLPYEDDNLFAFIYPNDNAIIRQYWSIDTFNVPSAGDVVVILGKFYKVFLTVFDYDEKTVYVAAEEI